MVLSDCLKPEQARNHCPDTFFRSGVDYDVPSLQGEVSKLGEKHGLWKHTTIVNTCRKAQDGLLPGTNGELGVVGGY